MKKLLMFAVAGLFLTTAVNANCNLPTFDDEKIIKIPEKLEFKEVQVFYWEVECEFGLASGTASSLEKAQKMVKLVSEKDIVYGELIGNGFIRVKQ